VTSARGTVASVIGSARGPGLLLTSAFWVAAGCGSSQGSTVSCPQSLDDYCGVPGSVCVRHVQLSSSAATTEASFCTQCGSACGGDLYSFDDCADGTLAVSTQVGAATASKGAEVVTYFYDAMTFELTAVLDSTGGGTYKPSLTCLGGPPTVPNHGVCPQSTSVPYLCGSAPGDGGAKQ
jgi:hypothetical protein